MNTEQATVNAERATWDALLNELESGMNEDLWQRLAEFSKTSKSIDWRLGKFAKQISEFAKIRKANGKP